MSWWREGRSGGRSWGWRWRARYPTATAGASTSGTVRAHDREARRDFRPGQDPAAALAEVIAVVRARRVAGAPRHPANTLAREGWLRALVVHRPELAGASRLRPVGSPWPRPDLRRPAPVAALGTDPDGAALVVVCSTGVDLDLVPVAADLRGAHSTASDGGAPGLALVVPAGDDYPVTRQLAARLHEPARVVTVPASWPELLG